MSGLALAFADRDRGSPRMRMLVVLMAFVVGLAPPAASEDVDCCKQPYSYFDCTG